METSNQKFYIVLAYQVGSGIYSPLIKILGMYKTLSEANIRQKKICGDNYKISPSQPNVVKSHNCGFITFLDVFTLGDMDNKSLFHYETLVE